MGIGLVEPNKHNHTLTATRLQPLYAYGSKGFFAHRLVKTLIAPDAALNRRLTD